MEGEPAVSRRLLRLPGHERYLVRHGVASRTRLLYPEERNTAVFMRDKADNKTELLQRILETRPQLVRLGVRSIGLFGSFVRNEQTPSSDVDILVEFAPGQHNFDNFMDVSLLLEDVFGRRVDLVTRESLSPYIGPHILREVERVAIGSLKPVRWRATSTKRSGRCRRCP